MCVCVRARAMPRRALVAGSAGGGAGGGAGGAVGVSGVSLCLPELSSCLCFPCTVLLQHGADPNIRNTDGKSALDLAEPSAKAVLTGEYRKHASTLVASERVLVVCSGVWRRVEGCGGGVVVC